MPLFLKNKIVFIHIPKTGGSSFTQVLRQNGDNPVFHHGFLNGHSAQHTTFRELKELNLIPEGFKIVSIIRHPYERFVSEYNYRKEYVPLQQFADRLFFHTEDWDNHNLGSSRFLDESNAEIIKFENYEEDFKRIIGLDMNIHTHKSKQIITINDLTSEIKKQIKHYWAKDFLYF